MQYKNFTYILTLILLSSFKPQRFQVDGYLDDVSPNKQYVLYRAPDVWETGEYNFGNLRILNVKTGTITIVPEQIMIEGASSLFLDNHTVVMPPAEGRIDLYDIPTKAFKKTPLTSYNKKFITLQFALSKDKSKVALLFLDKTDTVEDAAASELNCRVELKVIDLKNRKEYISETHDYTLGTDIKSGGILWYNDQVVYSYQNKTYCYKLGTKAPLLIADYTSNYALHKNVLIFPSNTDICKFNFSNGSITEIALKDSPIDLRKYNKLYTTHNYGTKQAGLRIEDKQKYYYYTLNDKYEFVPQEKLMLYQDEGLAIELLLTPIPYGDCIITKEELLITETERHNTDSK